MNLKLISYNPKPNSAGFTLVETIATLFIFTLTVIFISSVFASAINMQRRAFNLQQVEENGNFLMETVAKEIRVATIDPSNPNNNCPATPANSLDITHPVNGTIRYWLNGTNLMRRVNGIDTVINGNTIEFTDLQFCISGNTTIDQQQPRVSLLATIRSRNTNNQAIVDFQTTLSSRYLQE